MITGTFNGFTSILLPAAPALASVEFHMHDKVSATPNPWTQQAQVIDWQVDYWTATATLPPMTRAQAQQWYAFLGECRGMANVFLLGDPLAKSPTGLGRGVPVVDGVGNLPRSTTLTTRGWVPNLQRLLNPGDYLMLSYRLYVNLTPVNSDSSGKATLNLWPRLRDNPTDGESIVLSYPKGFWRLADNDRSYSISNMKTFGISLKLTEAL